MDFIISTLYFGPIIIILLTYLFRHRTLKFAYKYENEIKLLGPFMRLFLYIFTTRFFYGVNGNKTMKALYVFCFQASLISFYISFTIRNGHYLSSLFLCGGLESILPMFFEIFIGERSNRFTPIAKCETVRDNGGVDTKFISKPLSTWIVQDEIQKFIDNDCFSSVDSRVVRRVMKLIEDARNMKIENNINTNLINRYYYGFIPTNFYVQCSFSLFISSFFIYSFFGTNWFTSVRVLQQPINQFEWNDMSSIRRTSQLESTLVKFTTGQIKILRKIHAENRLRILSSQAELVLKNKLEAAKMNLFHTHSLIQLKLEELADMQAERMTLMQIYNITNRVITPSQVPISVQSATARIHTVQATLYSLIKLADHIQESVTKTAKMLETAIIVKTTDAVLAAILADVRAKIALQAAFNALEEITTFTGSIFYRKIYSIITAAEAITTEALLLRIKADFCINSARKYGAVD